MADDDGFLTRWSRRKRGGDAPPAVPSAVADQPQENDAAPQEAGDEPFDLASLPSIEDLGADTDVSVFMHKGVPETLRNAALQRIWAIDPAMHRPETWAEYAWDFNDPNGMIGFSAAGEGFDPEAMLRQIIGEKAPEDDAAEIDGIDEAQPGAASTDSPTHMAVPSPEVRGGPELSREPASGAPESESLEQDIAASQRYEFENTGKNTLPPMKPRHGGALPK